MPMIKFLELGCPHCNNHIEIIVGPVQSLMVLGCPFCHAYLLYYLGKVYRLDEKIMKKILRQKSHFLMDVYLKSIIRDGIAGNQQEYFQKKETFFRKYRIVRKDALPVYSVRSPKKVQPSGGKKNKAVDATDICDLKILLETTNSVDDFLKKINEGEG